MSGISEATLLERAFENGTVPQGLDGFFPGHLALLIPQSSTEQFGDFISHFWTPWRGKNFNAATNTGENVVSRNMVSVMKLLGYSFNHAKSVHGFHVFPFTTSFAYSSLSNQEVLQIQYQVEGNPPIVKRFIDELVQIDEHTYLGRAYIKEKTNESYRLFAYFGLKR